MTKEQTEAERKRLQEQLDKARKALEAWGTTKGAK